MSSAASLLYSLKAEEKFLDSAKESIVDSSAINRKSMDHLWNASHEMFSTHPNLSHNYLHTFNDIGALQDIGNANNVDARICKYCDEILVPGITCKIRFKGGKGKQTIGSISKKQKRSRNQRINIICLLCNHHNSFIGQEKQKLKELEQTLPKEIEIVSKKKESTSKLIKNIPKSSKEIKNSPKNTMNRKQTNTTVSKVPDKQITAKSKKRKKQKNSLKSMLKQSKESSNTTSHSLSDFLQQL